MANFKCKSCNKNIFVTSYITKFILGKKQYFKSPNKKLICNCGGEVELIDESKNENISVNIGKFSSLSYKEKQESLKQRSRKDAKKQKYVENYKEAEHYEK